MIYRPFLVLLLSYGTGVSGAPSTVRSGDHPNFVRIVVDIPTGADWGVERVDEGYAVKVDGVAEYDLSGAFFKIPTTRITGMESQMSPTQLMLFSDCECHATAFLWKPDKLVVDINDGVAEGEYDLDATLEREKKTIELPILIEEETVISPAIIKTAPTLSFDVTSRRQAQIDSLEKVVVESLARAATQGLLAPSAELDTPHPEKSYFEAHFTRNNPGILTHTSIDDGTRGSGATVDDSDLCLPESYFSVADWASELLFADQIKQLRVGLVGEFDEVNPEAVVELSRAYISFGFGLEAQNALEIDGRRSQEREVLAIIGAVIDGMPVAPGVLESQIDCDGPAALWAFLAGSQPPAVAIDHNSILREFRSLPMPLQSHLGPSLSEQFRAVGDFDAAEMVLSSGLHEDNTTFEAEIAQTELLIDLGRTDEATQVLANLVASDSRMTSRSLIDYLTIAVETKSDVDPEAIGLGDILRHENKGSAVVGDLAAAQVGALIFIDDLSAAFGLLEEEAEAIGEFRVKAMTSSAVLSAVEGYQDASFLELAFSAIVELVDYKAQNRVAARLLSLGLPERAAQIVRDAATGGAMKERRYLRGQAAIDLGDSEAALVEIRGLTTGRAQRMRRQVELIVAGQGDLSAAIADDDWKLGNWAALAQSDDVLLQDVSQSVLSETKGTDDAGMPLESGRRLLAQSSEMRDILNEMLTRFEPVQE